jgi:Tol biopolymer transport system component
MKPILVGIVAATLMFGADKAQDAERLLKAAINTELVDGNLKAAIEQYRKVAQSGVRPVAAQALIRMAECYQKLGDAESRRIYEQVVKDYADQKDAVAIARVKLGAGASDSRVVARQMWTGPKVDVYGTVSADGRLLSFTDWDTGDLAIHDFTTGQDRHLTNKGTWNESGEFALISAISRDGRQVAYEWTLVSPAYSKDLFTELRLIDLNSGKPRVLVASRPGVEILPRDWSPDGKWIAAGIYLAKENTQQIGLVSTADGTLRVLKSSGGQGRLAFSPDGKYLACDLGEDEQREIHLFAVDGTSEASLSDKPANDRVLGWSPDGRQLLFASDRTGLSGIWAIAVTDGKPQGAPQLIKPNVNPNAVGIMTRSGALYYGVTASGRDVYVASVNFETGKMISPPAPVPQPYLGLNDSPQWSRDGKYLAYLAQREANSRAERRNILAIRSADTGKVRELKPDLKLLNSNSNFTQPLWSPDSASLLVNGIDMQGRGGIYRIDARNGNASPVVLDDPGTQKVFALAWSRDGRTLYLNRASAKSSVQALVARDLQSGQEREILRREGPPDYATLGWVALSPDGRLLAITAFDKSTQSGSLLVIPAEGGQPRELLRTPASGPEQLGAWVEWSPDGKYVIFRKGSPTRENFRIPVEGGTPLKYAGDWMVGPSTTNPDGRQVAFAMGQHKIEIWAMENFLPALTGKK